MQKVWKQEYSLTVGSLANEETRIWIVGKLQMNYRAPSRSANTIGPDLSFMKLKGRIMHQLCRPLSFKQRVKIY